MTEENTTKNYTTKSLPKSRVEITATVPVEKMHEYQKKACDEISKEVKVKGFRPGHVPPHVLEQYVEKKYILAQTQEIAIQRTYTDIVLQEKLQVVARPKVKIESDEPLKFTATVAIMPTPEIKDHKSIKVKKTEAKVTEKDIETVIEDMKKHGTTYKDVDREAKKGDRVEIDFEGFDQDGKAVENTKSKNHPVILGGESLIPGFEDQIIGLKKDQEKEFDITFPKDYGKKDFQGKKLKFKVKVHRIEEPKDQEVDAEFIEKMTGKKQSYDEFKKHIEENIKARKEQEAKKKQENEYVEQLLKKTKVELPDDLLDEEAEFILQDMKEEIQAKGHQFDKFLEQAKTTEDDLRKKYRPEAEKRIKIRLALQYVIKEEKIEVSQKDMNVELEKVKSYYPPEQHEKIQTDFETGSLGRTIANRLALKKLFEKVLA